MKIRSLTCFYNPGAVFADRTLINFARMASKAKKVFSHAGLEIQSVRLATPPFPFLFSSDCLDSGIAFAQTLENKALDHDFNYLSLGPAVPENPESYTIIPKMIAATKNTFFGGIMVENSGISLDAIRACAQIITETAKVDAIGFSNLRFAALANIKPFTPFFPAAFGEGDSSSFAFALEAADLAVNVFSNAKSLRDARTNLIQAIESSIQELINLGNSLAQDYKCAFRGVDLSLAPFPSDQVSIGNAFEALGLPGFGLAGSAAAAAFLASILDSIKAPRVGFCGLMLPVLEDSVLAARTIDKKLTIKDLLLFSTLCGTGLDTIPLPGDVTSHQITALLLDIASISQRLQKPLTARLMPIKGKKVGDLTDFDFEYFANGRIMQLEAEPLTGLFHEGNLLEIQPRP